jgi:predicted unusual protein kinase regulating ubiquinone biosynthesis (AarF/ABC1/UbiB family)
MGTSMPRIDRFSQFLRSLRVMRLLLWTIWVIYRERKRVIRARERGDYDAQPNIQVLIRVLVEFRQTALKLGVLMIKLGQFLSTRADLLPEQALAVLGSLQDEVPPEPFEHVEYVLETELHQPIAVVFSSIERESTAAASLGQVHKAILAKTGETVAVKVQRPNTDQLVASDLSTLRFVIWLINRFIDIDFIDLNGVYREFKRTVYEEIDFVTEAANARRFREMFKESQTIYIPRFYDEYVTRRVLVLEWIDGIKVNDYKEIEAAGFNRLEIANRVVSAYFRQFFEAGFFHADPHPGNIFVRRDSVPENPIIAFIDFGMVGSITTSMKRALRDVFLSIVTRDAGMMARGLTKLGFIGEGANDTAIEQALSLLLDQYYGMTLGQARNMDVDEMGREVENLLYGQPFHIPSQFAFTGRAISTLVGVATGLAPGFNFIDVATPYARSFLGLDSNNVRDTLQQTLTQLLDTSRVLLSIPRSVDRLIGKIEAGQVEIQVANFPGARPSRRNRGRNRRGSGGVGIGRIATAAMVVTALGSGIFLGRAWQRQNGPFPSQKKS